MKALIAAIAITLIPPPVAAQCIPHGILIGNLIEKYGEARSMVMSSLRGDLVEIYTSGPDADNPTWSIIITTPQGCSRLGLAGEYWEHVGRVEGEPS